MCPHRLTRLTFLLLAALAVGCDRADSTAPAAGTRATVALLGTTDLHTAIMSYDYFKLAEDKSSGLERTATLIKAARSEYPNTLLFDNGDTLQGTVLADYQATVSPVSCETPLAQYKVMNHLKYDAATLGNHEFNYGLAYLSQVTGSMLNVEETGLPTTKCAGPDFPVVLANVVSAKDGQPLLPPYTILEREFSATTPGGAAVTASVKVGVLGLAPPPIVTWDKRWLDGKVSMVDALAATERSIGEMRDAGADLVVVLEHGGIDPTDYAPTQESLGYHVSKVPGVDAMFLGHSHLTFPSSTYVAKADAGIDAVNGLVNGVPSVMASFWGKALGVIKLEVEYGEHGWQVDTSKTAVAARMTGAKNDSGVMVYVDADPEIAPLVASEHQATIAYVKTPIGTTDFRMTTYFADVGDVSAVQVVNQAQAAYVADAIKTGLPQYQALPVLSVSAPFKSGNAGATDYTDVAAGNMAINNAADLYLYPNTVYAVKVTGQGLKDWLEKAAERFNTIATNVTTAQELISTKFPGYNFDVFSTADLRYEIDVTQPAGSRIVNVVYQGAALDLAKEFIVATNNYRATGGGAFPGLDGKNVILASPDANRDTLISYIKAAKALTRAANGSARSWSFKKVTTQGPVVFHSAKDTLEFAQAAGLTNVSVRQADDGSGKGLSLYQVDLSK